eukprot:SAG11_NODE_1556_length_4688_cov_7.338636_3_plen_344_part_00
MHSVDAKPIFGATSTRCARYELSHTPVAPIRATGGSSKLRSQSESNPRTLNHHFLLCVRRAQRGGNQEKRKPDIPMDITVTLQELYLGSSRTVKLRQQILCPGCRGTGSKGGEMNECKKCGGKGHTIERRQVGPGFIQQVQVDCRKCEGTGRISKAECPSCEGRKVQTGDKELEIYLEQGMPDGQEIVMEGEGDQGPGEAPAHIKFYARTEPHPLFRRSGPDLHIDIRITLLEALLGFERSIEHLDGHVVTIERTEVTKPGHVDVKKDEGMPVWGFPSDKGNLVAHFIIELPENLTPEQKAGAYTSHENESNVARPGLGRLPDCSRFRALVLVPCIHLCEQCF